jgi:predicted RNase H-like nuclease (RuvC/YqgF family)
MNEAVDILTILTDVAPLVLSTLILGSIVLFALWAAIKVVIPAMRELVQMSEAQRKAWQAIVDEQKRANKAITEEMQRDLTEERVERKKLAVKVAEMEAELLRKDTRIEEMQAELDQLRKTLSEKDAKIAELVAELNREKESRKRIEQERGELLHRIEALEKAQAAPILPIAGTEPPKDGKPAESESKAA